MIGIIGFESLRVMQYLKKYTRLLDDKGVDYQVVYWNRTGEPNPDKRYIPFEKPINTYVPFKNKLINFISYARFLYTHLRTHRYERLIILTTQTAIVLSPLLLTSYRNKYIYDYRDITFERYPLYKLIVRKLFHHSYHNAVSSPGFMEEIGIEDSFIISHNCNEDGFHSAEQTVSEKIRIVYWGMVRQVEFNKKICDLFGNDERFQLIYHGEGFYRELERYCKDKNYSNVTFTGPYNPAEIQSFAAETDILLNTYANDYQQKSALTVKLYDAMQFQLPMLITEDSYMADYLKHFHFSYAVSPEEEKVKDAVADWYKKINKHQVTGEYQELFKDIQRDNERFENTLYHFGTEI